MSNEDLPAVQHITQWDATVILPFLQDVHVVDEDDEVVGAALVEDLGAGVVAASHDGLD